MDLGNLAVGGYATVVDSQVLENPGCGAPGVPWIPHPQGFATSGSAPFGVPDSPLVPDPLRSSSLDPRGPRYSGSSTQGSQTPMVPMDPGVPNPWGPDPQGP